MNSVNTFGGCWPIKSIESTGSHPWLSSSASSCLMASIGMLKFIVQPWWASSSRSSAIAHLKNQKKIQQHLRRRAAKISWSIRILSRRLSVCVNCCVEIGRTWDKLAISQFTVLDAVYLLRLTSPAEPLESLNKLIAHTRLSARTQSAIPGRSLFFSIFLSTLRSFNVLFASVFIPLSTSLFTLVFILVFTSVFLFRAFIWLPMFPSPTFPSTFQGSTPSIRLKESAKLPRKAPGNGRLIEV